MCHMWRPKVSHNRQFDYTILCNMTAKSEHELKLKRNRLIYLQIIRNNVNVAVFEYVNEEKWRI